jgi:nitric oxide reductase activation protein
MAVNVVKRSKVETLVEELKAEEQRLNREIAAVIAQIEANASAPQTEQEIEEALRATIRRRSDAFKETTRNFFQFHKPGQALEIVLSGEMLVNGLHYLWDTNPAAFKALLALAPEGGIAQAERERKGAALEAKREALEKEREELRGGSLQF